VHRLSSEEHHLCGAHLTILVLVDISMILEARKTNHKAISLPMPNDEEIREVSINIYQLAQIPRGMVTPLMIFFCGGVLMGFTGDPQGIPSDFIKTQPHS
jgi:hypothetical protein